MAVRPVGGYLDNSTLATLASELEKQGALLQRLRKQLPDFLGQHCIHCIHKSGKLVVYVDSAAFATQMRFHTPALLPAIREATGLAFTSLQIRTILHRESTPSDPPVNIAARRKAGHHVLSVAEDHPDGDIQAALWRLGKTLSKDA